MEMNITHQQLEMCGIAPLGSRKHGGLNIWLEEELRVPLPRRVVLRVSRHQLGNQLGQRAS